MPPDGVIIVNRDDPNALRAVEGLDRRIVTYGLQPGAGVSAQNVVCDKGFYRFDVTVSGKMWCRARLSVPGEHNLSNALAAAACAVYLGVSPQDFAAGIAAYRGVGRRFESKGEYRGALLFDDYAHHPSEIEATLKAARAHGAAPHHLRLSAAHLFTHHFTAQRVCAGAVARRPVRHH